MASRPPGSAQGACPLVSILRNTGLGARILLNLDHQSLCRLSQTSKELHDVANDDAIWRELAVQRWDELKLAKDVEKDPSPAWKNLYSRKAKESTSLRDFARELKNTDAYACPNGHIYFIGECRFPKITAKCPECGAFIGGKSHKMVQTNKRLGRVNDRKLLDEHGTAGIEEAQKAFATRDLTHADREGGKQQKQIQKMGLISEEEAAREHANPTKPKGKKNKQRNGRMHDPSAPKP